MTVKKIGGDDIEDDVKQAVRNLFHENIDVHSRILIDEFQMDGINSIKKLQSYFANMTFSEKSRHDRNFLQVTNRGREYALN